jgi:hypothetical protein
MERQGVKGRGGRDAEAGRERELGKKKGSERRGERMVREGWVQGDKIN